MDSILNWEERVKELKKTEPEAYNILNRIYNHYLDEGTMIIPESFKDKALSYMGDSSLPRHEALKRIEKQRIIKFHNKYTGEGAVFNSLRSQRPGLNVEKGSEELENLIRNSRERCDFCNPEKYTPEDPFGRVKGKHSITASNLAKYDAWSSLLIFKKHNPLEFNLLELSDYINTAFSWFNHVYKYDKSYQFPFLVWNCLYKSGASQVHGHAQLLMARDIPYAKIGINYNAAENYKNYFNKDYFSDLFRLYDALGLARSEGKIKILLNITPAKEKEAMIISPDPPSNSHQAKEVIYKVLRCYIDVLGVESFNLAIQCPNITDPHSPFIIKIIDRGRIFSKTVDIGGMELYGSIVASEDPYHLISVLNKHWDNI